MCDHTTPFPRSEAVRTCVRVGILHADLDSFFASVEQRDDPRLRGRPVIVGGGVVLAASYEAKAFGVRTAMGQVARESAVPGRGRRPAALRGVLRGVEGRLPGLRRRGARRRRALDRRGVPRRARHGAERRHAARDRSRGCGGASASEVGLPITVGIARTKFLAKVASGVAKPDGLLVVPPERELAFLHPLEVERLWGVGPVTGRRLRALGVSTVGQVAELSEPVLVAVARPRAGTPAARARAEPRPATRPDRGAGAARSGRSARAAATAGRRSRVDADLVALVDRVTRRMRKARRVGRTVVLRLRFDDFTRATRSQTLLQSTASTETILAGRTRARRRGAAAARASAA